MNEADVGLVVEPSIFVRYEATRGEPQTRWLPGTPDEVDIIGLDLTLGDGTTIELTPTQEQVIMERYQRKIEDEILNGRAN
jgi:hypothetical protein